MPHAPPRRTRHPGRGGAPLLALALAAGCAEPGWSTAAGPFDEMVLSVWGSGASDVWAVGGGCKLSDCPATSSARVLHFDGGAWRSLEAPVRAVLWWVHGFSPTDVWMAGEQGVVLHWDGSRLERVPANIGAGVRLYGLWGASSGDVWAVGGQPGIGSTMLRGGLAGLSEVADAPPIGDARLSGAWFKVWGSAADDVWMVGERGTVVRFDGARFHRADLGPAGVTTETLTTVAGRTRDDVWAVGGAEAPITHAVAIHFDGTAWSAVPGLPLAEMSPLMGVHAAPTGEVAFSGPSGRLFVGRPGALREQRQPAPRDDLHAVWMLSGENLYAAGGDFFRLGRGRLSRYGR